MYAENQNLESISQGKNNGIWSVGGNKFKTYMVLLLPSY